LGSPFASTPSGSRAKSTPQPAWEKRHEKQSEKQIEAGIKKARRKPSLALAPLAQSISEKAVLANFEKVHPYRVDKSVVSDTSTLPCGRRRRRRAARYQALHRVNRICLALQLGKAETLRAEWPSLPAAYSVGSAIEVNPPGDLTTID
jgi:hypothetical protein